MDYEIKRKAALVHGWMRMLALAGGSLLAVAANAAPNVVNDERTKSPAMADPQVVQAKIQAAQQQAALINQIADKFQAEAAAQYRGDFNALDWKLNFGMRLIYQSASALASALSAGNLGTMQSGLASVGTAKHASDLNQVITLLPNPCRIVDTRLGGGGMLGSSFRFWFAFDTPATIAAQGGNASGCGSFPQADSFLLYVIAVPPGAPLSPGGPNFLIVQHDNVGPTSSTMNYYPGVNIANFAVPACNGCAGVLTGGFYAFASSPTHVVIDLVGVGGPLPVTSLWASIDAAGTLVRNLHASTAALLGPGSYEVIFDRNVTGCAYNATIGDPGNVVANTGQITVQQRAGNANGVFVETRDTAGLFSSRPFYVSVNCP